MAGKRLTLEYPNALQRCRAGMTSLRIGAMKNKMPSDAQEARKCGIQCSEEIYDFICSAIPHFLSSLARAFPNNRLLYQHWKITTQHREFTIYSYAF